MFHNVLGLVGGGVIPINAIHQLATIPSCSVQSLVTQSPMTENTDETVQVVNMDVYSHMILPLSAVLDFYIPAVSGQLDYTKTCRGYITVKNEGIFQNFTAHFLSDIQLHPAHDLVQIYPIPH